MSQKCARNGQEKSKIIKNCQKSYDILEYSQHDKGSQIAALRINRVSK